MIHFCIGYLPYGLMVKFGVAVMPKKCHHRTVKFTCMGPFIPATSIPSIQHSRKVSNDFTGTGETRAAEAAAATIMLQAALELVDEMPDEKGEIPEDILSVGTTLPF